MTIDETLNAIGAYLRTLPELEGIGVVVDNQQDMDDAMQKSVQRSKGYVVTVGEVSNKSQDDHVTPVRVELLFGVSIYSPFVVKNGDKTGSELRNAILRALHNNETVHDSITYQEVFYKDGKTFVEKDKQGRRMVINAMKFSTISQY